MSNSDRLGTGRVDGGRLPSRAFAGLEEEDETLRESEPAGESVRERAARRAFSTSSQPADPAGPTEAGNGSEPERPAPPAERRGRQGSPGEESVRQRAARRAFTPDAGEDTPGRTEQQAQRSPTAAAADTAEIADRKRAQPGPRNDPNRSDPQGDEGQPPPRPAGPSHPAPPPRPRDGSPTSRFPRDDEPTRLRPRGDSSRPEAEDAASTDDRRTTARALLGERGEGRAGEERAPYPEPSWRRPAPPRTVRQRPVPSAPSPSAPVTALPVHPEVLSPDRMGRPIGSGQSRTLVPILVVGLLLVAAAFLVGRQVAGGSQELELPVVRGRTCRPRTTCCRSWGCGRSSPRRSTTTRSLSTRSSPRTRRPGRW